MNVKELIERIKRLDEPYLKAEFVLELVKQLDEPQPVKVPQCVADWYERNENDLDYNIWDYIYNWEDQEESEFKNWFNCSKKAFQTLVNMHQFGYEVDEEKRYLVRVRGDLWKSRIFELRKTFEKMAFFRSERKHTI